MLTSRRGRLPNVHRFLRYRSNSALAAIGFIGNEVAGEDLEDVFRRSDYRRHVQSDMDRTAKQSFFLDLVAGETDGENGSHNGNRLDETLGESPSTGANDSAFHTTHRTRSV